MIFPHHPYLRPAPVLFTGAVRTAACLREHHQNHCQKTLRHQTCGRDLQLGVQLP